MKNLSYGFSLIELMIVVAIIGVLSAITIPSYQGYVLKSQVNRALGELAHYKTAVETQLAASASVNNQDLGYIPSTLTTGSATTDIAVVNGDGSGHIQVTMGGSAHPRLAGLILRYERSGAGTWQCIIDPSAASGWRNEFSPGSCTVI
jgi:type IV pilus assembly protein PilA